MPKKKRANLAVALTELRLFRVNQLAVLSAHPPFGPVIRSPPPVDIDLPLVVVAFGPPKKRNECRQNRIQDARAVGTSVV